MTDFLSTTEAGERLGITGRRVQEMIKEGRLPAVRQGRNYRIPRRAYEDWLAGLSAAALASVVPAVEKETPHA